MFLEIVLACLVILFVTSCYIIWNLNTKLESLEDWIIDFINTIEKVQLDLKKVDYKGYFEADDEVGQIFNQIKTTINQLNRFKGEEQ
tara:strand:+ start:1405 stop:1665 length:261 start_codon:yes stop_codon:yes gene_type:complete